MNIATTFDPAKSLIVTDKYAAIREKSEVVIQCIFEMILSGKSLSLGCSFGKDSVALLVLSIEALKRAKALDIPVKGFHVTTSNTGLESATDFYVQSMLNSLRDYSEMTDLGIQVHEVFPELTSSFMYSTVGRGRVPVFPGDSRKCSVDWKVRPQQKVLKQILKESGGIDNHITMIGTRTSESNSRKESMEKRGETSTSVNKDAGGFLVAAPIADWDTVDVWKLLMSINPERGTPTYETFVPNFEWTLDIYKDSNEGTCAIIVGDQGNKAACGSRHGCSMCTAISKDRSLESMIENNPEGYGHLKNVNILRNYIFDTKRDLSLRTVFGQTVSEAGYINCRPDNYNWKMRKRLLSYFITLDQDERERAEEHNDKWEAGEIEHTPLNDRLRDPQFEFVSFEMLMAIEFIWSVQCVSDMAFPALSVWYDVVTLGRKKYAPILSKDEIKNDKIPAKRFLFVGDDSTMDGNDGLRNIYLEATNGRRGLKAYDSYTDKITGKETRVTPFEAARKMTIDKEEACAFMTLEFDEIYPSVMNDTNRNSLSYLLHRGIIKIGAGKIKTYDLMAKRYQHLHSMLLTFNTFDNEGQLQKETISNAEHGAIIDSINGSEELVDKSVAISETKTETVTEKFLDVKEMKKEKTGFQVKLMDTIATISKAKSYISRKMPDSLAPEQTAFVF